MVVVVVVVVVILVAAVGSSGETMIPHNGYSSGIVKSTLLTNWFIDNINMRFERKTYDFSISNRSNRC